MHDEARAMILKTLQGIEEDLIRRVDLARMNALLGLADPALVLPSPGVGLMALQARRPIRTGPSTLLRSLEPICAEGEVLLAPVEPEITIHPWQVRRATWQVPGSLTPEAGQVERPLVPRLQVELVCPEDSVGSAGWLSLHVAGPEGLRWALARARVYFAGLRLPSRSIAPPSLANDATGSPLSVTLHHLQELSENLLLVEIPQQLASRTELTLELFFPEGLRLADLGREPVALANVYPVWNSLACRAPAFHEIDAATRERGNRFVHPLVPSALGTAWRAWSLVRVGAAVDARLTLSDFHLAYLPAEGLLPDSAPTSLAARAASMGRHGAAGLTLIPCVVLSVADRERLDRTHARLELAYRATMGTRTGAVPAGAEFRVIETTGSPGHQEAAGRLVTGMLGASDGLLGDLSDGREVRNLAALHPGAGRGTIGELIHLFERAFGNDLELVDERDLLRFDGTVANAPLVLRVRTRQPALPPAERAALVRSCGALLGRYLAVHEKTQLRVVEHLDLETNLALTNR